MLAVKAASTDEIHHRVDVGEAPSSDAVMMKLSSYKSLTKEPLTDEILKRFEKEHGIRVPKEMSDILRQTNGGYVPSEFGIFRARGKEYSWAIMLGITCKRGDLGIRPASDIDFGDPDSVKNFTKKLGNLDRVFVFGDFSGHDLFCLNYNSGKEPSVAYLEFDGEDVAETISPSFREFVDPSKWEAQS